MSLEEFKLEGDYFNEDNLHDMLYQYYDDTKYFIKNQDILKVEGAEGALECKNSFLSEDNKFLCVHKYEVLEIYSLTTYGKLNKTLSYTITNFPKLRVDSPRKMVNNLIYFIENSYLRIIDIQSMKLSTIALKGIYDKLYVYKGIVCLVSGYSILIINLDGSRKLMYASFETSELENNSYNNGILYICAVDRIHRIDIEKNEHTTRKNEHHTLSIFPLSSGAVCSVSYEELILPSGKVLTPQMISEKFDRYGFRPRMMVNYKENKLVCFISLDILIIIDLKTEMVIEVNPNLPHDSEFGFLEPSVANLIEPVTVDYINLGSMKIIEPKF
jgi:hypothetical protein